MWCYRLKDSMKARGTKHFFIVFKNPVQHTIMKTIKGETNKAGYSSLTSKKVRN